MATSTYNFIRFNHVSVDEIKEHTPKQVATIADRYNANNNTPRVKTKEFDGIPVNNELSNFCTNIKQAFPTIKFGMNKRGGITWAGETHAAQLYMYYDGDEFAVGRIHTGMNHKGQTTFHICAPHVLNARYRGGDEQTTVGSADMGKALKLVKTYARRYTPRDIALMHFSDFSNDVRSQRNKASAEVSRSKQSLMYNDELIGELLHLHRSGHKFISDRFSDTLNTLIAAMEKDKEAKAAGQKADNVVKTSIEIAAELIKV